MKSHNFKIICICIFAAMWGAIEIFLGSILHQIPGKPIPTAMTIMILVIPLLVILYKLTGCIKVILAVGLITAILKLFSPGGAKFNPFISIIIEALIFSLIFFLIPEKLKKTRIIAAGILTSAGGSMIGRVITYYIFGYFKEKTLKYFLIFVFTKIGTGITGGIIGSILAFIILDKIKNHPLLQKKNTDV